jgi:predicted dithiol-disulfide oxidoreductase (DUF899 family)
MTPHDIGTRERWLSARRELLEREKELTRRSDELARERQALPWVRVDQAYSFETSAGPKSLAELFDGRSQLLVYHLMFGPEDSEPCIGCSFTADNLDGAVFHLAHHDVTFVAVSRAPFENLDAYRRRSGWSFPLHGGRAAHGQGLQLRHRACRPPGSARHGASRAQRVCPRGRRRLPHVLLL